MKVKAVKYDAKEDYTMSLPIQILPALNADKNSMSELVVILN